MCVAPGEHDVGHGLRAEPNISSMKKTRIALIGAGSMAKTMHHPSLAGFEDVSLVAVCDLDVDVVNHADS